MNYSLLRRACLDDKCHVGIMRREFVRKGGVQLLALVFKIPTSALRTKLQTHVDRAHGVACWLRINLMQDAHAQVRRKPW